MLSLASGLPFHPTQQGGKQKNINFIVNVFRHQNSNQKAPKKLVVRPVIM
jgi:hypothetical protein